MRDTDRNKNVMNKSMQSWVKPLSSEIGAVDTQPLSLDQKI